MVYGIFKGGRYKGSGQLSARFGFLMVPKNGFPRVAPGAFLDHPWGLTLFEGTRFLGSTGTKEKAVFWRVS